MISLSLCKTKRVRALVLQTLQQVFQMNFSHCLSSPFSFSFASSVELTYTLSTLLSRRRHQLRSMPSYLRSDRFGCRVLQNTCEPCAQRQIRLCVSRDVGVDQGSLTHARWKKRWADAFSTHTPQVQPLASAKGLDFLKVDRHARSDPCFAQRGGSSTQP
jgi:hypothetical protein